ncbi:O-antigen polymerase [Stanieria cyanosphaera PCC 7437]|uniref:O-antigen polymerase n=1 Tax=Stanieria cyanosphaera (strain ATCC 29371 / PCC 7437) TaxID=111780 RepID=K9XTN6_STAC7|nr:O-antigen ligase family protein [Stanieria cyanosphaera]AFZ35027.1 O-antigen polymerase [Stanieria cyanosphaera PCC 7437]
MNPQYIKLHQFIHTKIEPVIAVLLILYYFGLNLPPIIGTAAKYLCYLLVAGLVIINFLTKGQKFAYVATRDLFPWLLLGLSFASILWSAAPEYTSDEVEPLLRASLLGAYLATRYTIKDHMWLLLSALGIAAFFSIMFAVIMPNYAIDFVSNNEVSWQGIFNHKQYLGRQMAIGVITCLHLFLDKSKHRFLLLGLLFSFLILVILSSSKSALILLFFSLLLFPIFTLLKQGYRLKVAISIFAFLIITSIAILITINLETIVVDILGKDLTFNGRTTIWSLALEKGWERPWLGYGYSGFWTSDAASYILNNTWAVVAKSEGERFHAHNGLIDVFLQLGLVGLTLCLLSFLRLSWRAINLIQATHQREFLWILQFLFISFLANFSEIRTFIDGGAMWVLYISFSFLLGIWWKRIKSPHRNYKKQSYVENKKLMQKM